MNFGRTHVIEEKVVILNRFKKENFLFLFHDFHNLLPIRKGTLLCSNEYRIFYEIHLSDYVNVVRIVGW